MQTLTYKVNFAPEGIPTTVRLSQNENGRSLQFVFIGDRITIPNGSVVTISGTKPDGHVYSAEGTLDGEVATFDEEIQMTAAAGEWAAKLKVTHSGLTVATQRLWMIIDADTVLPGSVPSESELNGLVAEAQQYAENARSAAYGSPLTAALVADMLDTSRVYVYTGSETGMIFGHWYYYEDGAWEDGGVYQSQGVQTDTTLEILGMPADAKATGDALAGKVDAETGKGLSSNDFTTAEKNKLAGIADQATHVVIDSTLEQTGQAADAKVVGDEIDGLKEDLSELEGDFYSYEIVASGNSIDVSDYGGVTFDKVTSAFSVGTAATTFNLYCCGKNHFKGKINSGGVNNFTWESKADGTVVLNGTTDRNYQLSFGNDIGTVLCVYNTKWRSSIQKSAVNDDVQIRFNGLDRGDSYEFDKHTTDYAKDNFLYIPSGVTCDNLVVRPMVEFGDYETSISYEAFSGFIKTYTFDSAVTSGNIDWGAVEIPENATTLWMYDTTSITTLQKAVAIGERLDVLEEEIGTIAEEIDGAYSHKYVVAVDGWSDSSVSYENGFINSSGGVTSNSGFRHSNFIPCSEGDLIQYNLYGYSTQVYIVTFYDVAKTRVSGIVGQTGYKAGSQIAPEGTAFVCFSTSNSNVGTFTISELTKVTGDVMKSELIEYTDERTSVARTGIVLTRADIPIIEGSMYTNIGIYNSTPGARRTDYIPVSEGDVVDYRCRAYIGQSVKEYTITAFDENKAEVSHIMAEETGMVSGTYTVPSGVSYVMISWMWAMTQDGWFSISEGTYNETLANLVESTKRMPNSPLNGKQWCCLGDSITFGANTTKTYFNFIEDRCGVTPWNFGQSNTAIAKSNSSVTNNMATRYTDMYDDVDYVTVLGGTNDHGQNIPIGQWGDTEQTTLYGALKVLCDGLTAKYIGKKIGFILPLPKYGQTGGVYHDYSYPNESFYPYIQCIEDVCRRYSIPVLNLYLESGLTVGNADVRTAMIPDGLHPNATGHEYISRKIQSFLESL